MLAGFLALSTAGAGCSDGKAKEKSPGEADTQVPVEVQPVRKAAMLAVYSGTAPIEAHEEAEVVAKVGGEVRQIYVEEGDTVTAGQLLARLDGDRLRLEVQQTEACSNCCWKLESRATRCTQPSTDLKSLRSFASQKTVMYHLNRLLTARGGTVSGIWKPITPGAVPDSDSKVL